MMRYCNMKFKKNIQNFLKKIVGLNKVEDELKTLQYFFNLTHKPADIKCTEDKQLKIMQECDALLLAIFDKFCEKHHLGYWIDYGSLLGYVRHGGFIPWDDDMDVSMERSDYIKALPLLYKELEPYGIKVKVDRQIGLGYKHEKTGVWLDIFAFDVYNSNTDIKKRKDKIVYNICRCGKKCRSPYVMLDEKKKELLRNKIVGGANCDSPNFCYLYLCPEFSYTYNYTILRKEDVIPLKKGKFLNYDVNIPNNYIAVLQEEYGLNFDEFPTSGILHHEFGRGPLSKWASNNNIDMSQIKSELEHIYFNFK